MIVLKVKEYCHDCLNFECDVRDERETVVTLDVNSFIPKDVSKVIGDVCITCKHREVCDNIENYLKERIKK